MRFLILIGTIYLCWKVIKSWFANNVSPYKEVLKKENTEIDDVMVRDPECGVYFPKRNSIVINKNGENLHFCSTECKDKYLGLVQK